MWLPVDTLFDLSSTDGSSSSVPTVGAFSFTFGFLYNQIMTLMAGFDIIHSERGTGLSCWVYWTSGEKGNNATCKAKG